MEKANLLRRVMGQWPLLLGLVIGVGPTGSTAVAQEKPAEKVAWPKLSEAERASRLQERDRRRAEGIRLANAGKLEEGVRELQAALAVDREMAGDFSDDVADTLDMLAQCHEFREDRTAARKALEELLAIRERQPNRTNWGIADSHRALADFDRRVAMTPDQRQLLRSARRLTARSNSERAQGRYKAAEGAELESLKIRGELLGQDHPDFATSLNNLGVLYWHMRDYARAGPLLRRAMEIAKKAFGEDHPGDATSLNNLGSLYREMGDYARAEPLYRRAVEIYKKELGEDHRNYANSLDNLGQLYQDMGDYARAEPLLRHAMEIRKKALGEDDPGYATSLNNLGLLYKATGDFARAEPLYRRAVEIYKKELGEKHPDYATSLSSLGSLYYTMGDYARAEPLFHRAMEATKEAPGENNAQYAVSLSNLGLLYKATGDFARAEPLYRRATEIYKKALGVDHPNYATTLNGLGLLYQAMGDYARAEPLLRRATEVTKKALGEDHPNYATGLDNLGSLYWAMGDYARAEPLNRRAVEIYKKALGEDHPDYATSLNNLGTLYMKMGDYPRAEPLVRRTMEITKKALGEDHPSYAANLGNLGILYQAMGENARAEALLREALDRTTALVHTAALAVGERQWLELLASLRYGLDQYTSVALDVRASAPDLYRHVLDWRGAADARQAETRLSRDQPELKPALEQLARTITQLAQLAFTSASPAHRSAWRRQLDELRERKENLEADLAARSAVYRQQKQSRLAGPDEVAAALPAGTALIDLLEYTHYLVYPIPAGI